MSFRLFETAWSEPGRLVGFAGSTIDRQSENRADDAVETALGHPRARVLLMRGGRLYLRFDNGAAEPGHAPGQAQSLGAKLEHGVLLGYRDGDPVIAAPAGIEPDDLPDDIKAIDYRSIMVQRLLGADDLGALAQGASLLAWHGSHRFCGRCGTATKMRAGGYKRVCPNCGAEHFPRTDPVAIMLAVDGERCLLGRSPHFAPGMYSCLAGFIEPGETIEDAVRRETFEEAGIRIGRVVYHASQPWPFPYSLMIGCYGEAVSTEIAMDRNELEDCRWFSRAEVRAALAGEHGEINIPPSGAIASHIIRAWAEDG
ncbi:MAG: NAD(+) diphosphatase [Rhizobiaceae bacterium]